MVENLCSRCKSPNRSNARFCAKCGALLVVEVTAVPEVSFSPELESSDADTGAVLQGRYRVIKELGRGGFGAVYRAWDANLNKCCAIKENLDDSPEAHRQFVREATVLANLSHPNLPRVTDHFFIPSKGQYLVMDFVEGEDLMSLVERQGAVTVDQALVWIAQVADALVYLHSRQPPVIHRDIKPSNIRITPDGRAMLVDFGLVKVFDPHMKTTMGARAVTPGYAPPEQYGQGKTDARSDLYALGATSYNLLTAQNPLESVRRMVGERMQPINQLSPRIPTRLCQVIERAMALEPGQRYQSVAEFKAALQSDLVTPGISGSPAEAGPPSRVEPTIMVKPMLEPMLRTAAHVPGTQAISPTPKTALPAQESDALANRRYLGIAVLVALLLCFGTAAGLASWAYQQQKQDEQATQDARELATMQERLNLTSTAESWASATAQVHATFTAHAAEIAAATSTAQFQGGATAQARESYVATVIANRSLVFGPTNGSLAHNADNTQLSYMESSANLSNFIVEVRFFNPYPTSQGTWDVGVIFRIAKGGHFRLVIKSDGGWRLWMIKDDPDASPLAKGNISNLDLSEGGSNWIRLICQGDRGWFYANGTFVEELDLSSWMSLGKIWAATGVIQGDEINGKSTIYQDFTIWSLP